MDNFTGSPNKKDLRVDGITEARWRKLNDHDSGIDSLPSPTADSTNLNLSSGISKLSIDEGFTEATAKNLASQLCAPEGSYRIPAASTNLTVISDKEYPRRTKDKVDRPSLSSQDILETVFKQDKDGDTHLHVYTCKGNSVAVQSILNLRPSLDDVNQQNSFKQTALHLAVCVESASTVELLLRYGADVELVDECGNSIWHMAAEKQNSFILKVIYFLFKTNILPRCTQEGLKNMLHAKNFEGLSPIHLAFKLNRKQNIALLLESGADVNDRDFGFDCTPLHYAARMGDATLITELIYARGAMVSPMAKNGATPLHYAIGHGHAAAVALLLGAGADAEAKTFEGDSARSYANTDEVSMVLDEMTAPLSF